MDLKDFVKATLVNIASGVKEAQEAVREAGGIVNPASRVHKAADQSHFSNVEGGANVFLIDFDVAVTVAESTNTGAGAKLAVATFLQLGVEGASDNAKSATHRIKFKVPLALPVDPLSGKALKDKEAEEARRLQATINSLQGQKYV